MIRTLQLVTTPRPFFRQQVEVLKSRGISSTTVSVPRPVEGSRSPRDYANFYRSVLRHVATGRFDLVHANYGLVAPFALAQPVRPVVLTLWGSDVMSDADWLTRLSAAAARRSDAVVAPSVAIADRLDCDHEVVPFGVDTERFRPMDRTEARRELGWDPDARIVLFPYDPERAVKNYPLAERVVDGLPVDAELKVMSGVPYEAVPAYMNASDAVLVTSRRESGPMVVKEAAACAVPVVSTDVGFARAVLDGVAHSHVCSSEHDLVAGLTEAVSTDERADGRDRIDALGLDAMGERLHAVYEDALDWTVEVPA